MLDAYPGSSIVRLCQSLADINRLCSFPARQLGIAAQSAHHNPFVCMLVLTQAS